MRLIPQTVEYSFKEKCEEIAGKDLPEGIFEGLDDITQLPNGKRTKFFIFEDRENGRVCVINGKYIENNDTETAAIAIGLWDKERNCFSVFAKMKDGNKLPLPIRVKGDKKTSSKMAENILRAISQAVYSQNPNLMDVLTKYNTFA